MRAQLLEDERTFRESLSLINQARGQNLLTTCRLSALVLQPYLLLVTGYPAEDATVPEHALIKKSLEDISSFYSGYL